MKRTTIYLEPDLDVRLRQEMRRQRRPMAELIRDAVRAYVDQAPGREPPGAGSFASGRRNTARRADAVLKESGFGEKR